MVFVLELVIVLVWALKLAVLLAWSLESVMVPTWVIMWYVIVMFEVHQQASWKIPASKLGLTLKQALVVELELVMGLVGELVVNAAIYLQFKVILP